MSRTLEKRKKSILESSTIQGQCPHSITSREVENPKSAENQGWRGGDVKLSETYKAISLSRPARRQASCIVTSARVCAGTGAGTSWQAKKRVFDGSSHCRITHNRSMIDWTWFLFHALGHLFAVSIYQTCPKGGCFIARSVVTGVENNGRSFQKVICSGRWGELLWIVATGWEEKNTFFYDALEKKIFRLIIYFAREKSFLDNRARRKPPFHYSSWFWLAITVRVSTTRRRSFFL